MNLLRTPGTLGVLDELGHSTKAVLEELGYGASEIDEHPSHRSRSYREKMPPVLPIDYTRVRHANERFVHERGGLEGVAGPLAPHVVRGLTSQLGIEN